MTAVCFLTVLLPLLLRTLASPSSTDFTHLNASNFLNATVEDALRPSVLQDVLRAISLRQSWSLRDTTVSKLDARMAMIGSYLSSEFRVHVNNTDLELKFSNEVADWKKLWKGDKRRRRNLKHLVKAIKNAEVVIDTFKLEGPFELRASGNDLLDIRLPMNTFHSGLSRILVSEGIAVEVRGAQDVSVFQNSSPGLFGTKIERDKFLQLLNPSCIRIPSVTISGSSTVIAYTPQNPGTPILGSYVTEKVIKLLPRKCYTESVKQWPCPMLILRSKVQLVGKLVKSIYDSKKSHHEMLSGMYILANIKASKVIRFNLELERKVRRIDNKLPNWRTKPSVERAWFDIVAKYGSGKLKPIIIKKVKHFVVVDSASWSSSMFNVSFAKFPSLAPSEALTLDINW